MDGKTVRWHRWPTTLNHADMGEGDGWWVDGGGGGTEERYSPHPLQPFDQLPSQVTRSAWSGLWYGGQYDSP
jgi:hypothetical protein